MAEQQQQTPAKSAIEYRAIQLPSRGVFDGDNVPGGKVGVRKFSGNEEAILLGQGLQGLERVNAILNNCVTTGNSNYPVSKLLITDRVACLIAIRTITFGSVYTFEYDCKACRSLQKVTIDIVKELSERHPQAMIDEAALAGKPAPDFTDPFDVTLPESGRKVVVRLLRGEDEDAIARSAKRFSLQSSDAADPATLARMARQIVTIDGEKPTSEAAAIMFVKALSGRDTATIRIAVDARETGYDMRICPTCRNCGTANRMNMPFDLEFFRPTELQP